MNAPERLALLVLANGVEVEARRAPQEQPASVSSDPAGVAEETVELDEPRANDDRHGMTRDLRRHRYQTEQVSERDLRVAN
jgi:hypothetical protein